MGEIELCDVCGSADLKVFKCKLVCQNCGTILKTCSDPAVVWSSIEVNRHGS